MYGGFQFDANPLTVVETVPGSEGRVLSSFIQIA